MKGSLSSGIETVDVLTSECARRYLPGFFTRTRVQSRGITLARCLRLLPEIASAIFGKDRSGFAAEWYRDLTSIYDKPITQ